MVKLLYLKMVRDMRKSLAAYLICVLVVGVGFCGYCVLSVAADHLTASQKALYESSAFADGFAEVHEAPDAMSRRLEQIPGIGQAGGRIVKEVRLADTGDEEAYLLLISYEPGGLDVPMLFQGADALQGKRQAVVGNAFLNARGLEPGDKLRILISGKEVELEITGGGISPENIYMVRNIAEMIPDPETYDAAFIPYDTMAELFGMKNLANNFDFILLPGYTVEDVKEEVETLLDPYGCYRVYGRKDQTSASIMESELEQLDAMAAVVPVLFLAVAAIILYITMHRMMDQQRIQIGTMRAMGIPRKIIGIHYLGYGAFIGVLGGAAGGLLGNVCARPLVEYYRTYFNLPEASAPISMKYLLFGILLAGSFCALVSFQASRRVAASAPAEAMRPPAPKSAKATAAERIPGFLNLFTVPGIMAVRGIGRNKKRSVLSLIGIACAFMITATLVSMNSLLDVYLLDYLQKLQKQDYTVYFEEPLKTSRVTGSVQSSLIERAEPFAEVPAVLMGDEAEMDVTVQAIPRDSELCHLYDEQGRTLHVASEGVVISVHMARTLDVKVGDQIDVKIAYPQERISSAAVTGILEQYLGTTVYMSCEGLGKISEYRDVCTGLFLKTAQGAEEEVRELFEESPVVAGVQSRQIRLQKWDTMMQSFELMIGCMVFLGILIGLSVLHTSALISFEELKRELSTMMMLGLRPGQCLEVLSVGQWILTAGGIIIGIPLTFAASRAISLTMTTEMYSIPDFASVDALAVSAVLMFGAVFVSSRLMLGKLRRISPVELLSERE